ncbi:OsmC family peroxiredoxin [Pelagicoccus sp. SDUM812003]|uniref:OsmC family peroxiredoxin n=1 Tax=Pelagicoccus sp. SDUM812003 TaxID=3041267 RepID=UPI00280CDAD8|nr:OsmC family peroxiredoxin [Pelagicoccus sp. SDUM812003]MDQ8201735.1 OsmC family peroxiredoxin [Pelagicoccus sp. SDUM812003]
MSTTTIVTRKSDASWKGDFKNGYGELSTESGTLQKSRFSLKNRMGEEGPGQTNPEELLAAAAASCFSMALSKQLTEAETVPSQLVVTASLDTEIDDGISMSKLTIDAEGIVPASDEKAFSEAVEETAHTCPVMKTLAPAFKEVIVNAKLRQ